jgi:hypothetical protein
MIRIWLLAAISCCYAQAAEEPVAVDEAFGALYNFHFQVSHQVLDRYIAAHPQEPLPYAVRASAYLFYELDRLGILESEFLIDDKRIAKKEQAKQPDPQVRAQFIKAIDDTESRAQAVLKGDPNDKPALFSLCIAQGVTTDYMAFVEKHQFRSLSPAEKSNSYAQRLLKLDPKFFDAYLTAGLSEYLVGSLPFFVRWFVHFDNVDGSKTKGVQNLETVAHEGHYLKPFGKILLGIIDLREKKYRDAQKLLVDLTHDYPENPLFRKELGKLNAKLGDSGN